MTLIIAGKGPLEGRQRLVAPHGLHQSLLCSNGGELREEQWALWRCSGELARLI